MDASLISLVGDGDLDGVKRHLDRLRRTHGQASRRWHAVSYRFHSFSLHALRFRVVTSMTSSLSEAAVVNEIITCEHEVARLHRCTLASLWLWGERPKRMIPPRPVLATTAAAKQGRHDRLHVFFFFFPPSRREGRSARTTGEV